MTAVSIPRRFCASLLSVIVVSADSGTAAVTFAGAGFAPGGDPSLLHPVARSTASAGAVIRWRLIS
jgi:hypothetical protein